MTRFVMTLLRACMPRWHPMSTRSTPLLFRTRHPLAVGLGLMLGQAVAVMAQRGESSAYGFFVATLFAASASASFVMFTLAAQQRGPAGAALSRQAHVLVGLIGLGLLLSLRAPELLG